MDKIHHKSKKVKKKSPGQNIGAIWLDFWPHLMKENISEIYDESFCDNRLWIDLILLRYHCKSKLYQAASYKNVWSGKKTILGGKCLNNLACLEATPVQKSVSPNDGGEVQSY